MRNTSSIGKQKPSARRGIAIRHNNPRLMSSKILEDLRGDVAEIKYQLKNLEGIDRTRTPMPPRGYYLIPQEHWSEFMIRLATIQAADSDEVLPKLTLALRALRPILRFINVQLESLLKREELRLRDA